MLVLVMDPPLTNLDDCHRLMAQALTTSGSQLPTGTFSVSQFLGRDDHETTTGNMLRALNTVNQEDEEIKRNWVVVDQMW